MQVLFLRGGLRFHIVILCGEDLCRAAQRLRDPRIVPGQLRHQQEPYAVPHRLRHIVRPVIPGLPWIILQKFRDVRPGDAEKGPDEIARQGPHPCQTGASAPSQQMIQHGLRLIIPVMGHGDPVTAALPGRPAERLIAELPRHGLLGAAVNGPPGGHIGLLRTAGHAQRGAHRLHEGRFLRRFLPQVMIHRTAGHREAFPRGQRRQRQQQRQRIRSAGHRPQAAAPPEPAHPVQKGIHHSSGFTTSASRSPSVRPRSLTVISGRAKYSIRLSMMATPATMISARSARSPFT